MGSMGAIMGWMGAAFGLRGANVGSMGAFVGSMRAVVGSMGAKESRGRLGHASGGSGGLRSSCGHRTAHRGRHRCVGES